MLKGFFAAALIAGVVVLGLAASAFAKNDKHGERFDAGAFADHRPSGADLRGRFTADDLRDRRDLLQRRFDRGDRRGRYGDHFTGSSMPPGFSHGNKHGWSGNRPPGWSKGNKKGWSGNVPPGLDR
jgi:hypothetical protein